MDIGSDSICMSVSIYWVFCNRVDTVLKLSQMPGHNSIHVNNSKRQVTRVQQPVLWEAV